MCLCPGHPDLPIPGGGRHRDHSLHGCHSVQLPDCQGGQGGTIQTKGRNVPCQSKTVVYSLIISLAIYLNIFNYA